MRLRLFTLLLLHGCAAPLLLAGGAVVTGVMVARGTQGVVRIVKVFEYRS